MTWNIAWLQLVGVYRVYRDNETIAWLESRITGSELCKAVAGSIANFLNYLPWAQKKVEAKKVTMIQFQLRRKRWKELKVVLQLSL